MRNTLAGLAAVIAMAMSLGVGGAGCSRERPATPDAQTMELALKLPGATNVLAALDKKDYAGAIAAWAKVKESPATERQQLEFSALTRELKTRLMEASAADPKAAEALEALRAFTAGR
jgi:hypothetical protein